MRPLKFSFLFYATAVMFGIGCKPHVNIWIILAVFCASILLLALSIRSTRTWLYLPRVFYFVGFLFYSLCFCTGFLATQFADLRSQWNNYAETVVDHKPYVIQFRVVEKQKSQRKQQQPVLGETSRFLVEIEAIDSQVTQGKATVLLVDHSTTVESTWTTVGYFQSFRSPAHRGQLDYGMLMEGRGISKQLYCNQVYKLGEGRGFHFLLFKIRAGLLQRIASNAQMSQQTKAVLLAVLLGDRTQLDESVVASFQQLGVMHVLAISGLHIGILYIFLNQLTYVVKRSYRSLIILAVLWLFVFLSGCTPSVFRAVFMFSLLTIASACRHKQSTLEIVGITLFLSLLFCPDWLFDVGFQLSYAAVLGIIWLMPLFKKLYTSNKVVNYFLGLVYVSFVAQCSVLPLQLYYFHSFSLTFLLSNLVVVPLITLLLILGLSFLCFGWMFACVEEYLGLAIAHLMRFVFSVLELLTQGNISRSDCYLTPVQLTVLFVCFFLLGILFYRPSIKRIKGGIIVSVPLVLLWVYPFIFEKKAAEFIVASTSAKTTLMVEYHNEILTLFSDSVVEPTVLQGYRNYFQPKEIKNAKGQAIYAIDANRYLLVLSQSMPYYELSRRCNVLYFQENCKVNGNRILEWHQPQYVILGKGMTKGYKKRIMESCRKKNIPFHDMSEKGYWVSQFF